MTDTAVEQPASYPAGEYAIVEVLGHRTIIGRVAEVERFGTKFLAVEAIWQGELLPAALIGGASVYQLTPCTAATAFERQATRQHQLPASLAIIAPAPQLEHRPAFLDAAFDCNDDADEDEEVF